MAKEEPAAVVPEAMEAQQPAPVPEGGDAPATYTEVLKGMWVLGWTAFGGPAAHLGVFKSELVEKRRWLGTCAFAELIALGQCLPGPTSTQVSFALGVTRAGILGGLLSGALFQYPGALFMSLAGVGAADWLEDPSEPVAGISAGLGAAGIALVIHAAEGLARNLCDAKETRILCLISACVAFYMVAERSEYKVPWLFPLLIALGGATTVYTRRNDDLTLKGTDGVRRFGVSLAVGGALILLWAGILVTVIIARAQTDYDDWKELHWFEVFYRTGSIIFGGGQVVLPLLLEDVVQYEEVCTAGGQCFNVEKADSWVTEAQFFAGLGVVQAMPGPLFNLAAYLGAVAARRAGVNAFVGIITAWLGLFGPGVVLIFGVLPFWGAFRQQPLYRRALPGLNSAAVGLVLAAAIDMSLKVRTISPFPDASVIIGLLAFVAVKFYKLQAPIAVVSGGILGLIAWATGCR